jgi:hypothetical protein
MSKTYHILNGGALVDRFTEAAIPGEVVVARECLIEGDLSGDTPEEFYQARAAYLDRTYNEDSKDYFTEVASEFQKLQAAPDGSEFNLWFGYDLFCQANMWFVLSLLQGLPIQKQVFIVYPTFTPDIWQDFGRATPADLVACFHQRVAFTDNDLQLATYLWQAYKQADLTELSNLSQQQSACFPYLAEVCRAHIERFAPPNEKGRPERVVAEILASGHKQFPEVFKEFYKREGIYGFGDVQVKRIYDQALQNQ